MVSDHAGTAPVLGTFVRIEMAARETHVNAQKVRSFALVSRRASTISRKRALLIHPTLKTAGKASAEAPLEGDFGMPTVFGFGPVEKWSRKAKDGTVAFDAAPNSPAVGGDWRSRRERTIDHGHRLGL